jgi:arsenate reductase
MNKPKVLFICIHNSARSQMAEALFDSLCGEFFESHSAGLESGTLNPLAVVAMERIGIDISKKRTKQVFDYIKDGTPFRYVVTVCDETSAERCPIFPFGVKREHWSFEDPSSFKGTWEEKLEATIRVRDQIKTKLEEWCETVCVHKLAQ